MRLIHRVAKNTTILGIQHVAERIFAFVIFAYMAKILGPSIFGEFSLAIAFSAVAFRMTDLGLNFFLQKEIPRDKETAQQYLHSLLGLRIITAIFTVALVMLVGGVIGYSKKLLLVMFLITSGDALASLTNLFSAVFQANEKMEYDAMGSLGAKILKIILAIALLAAGYGIIEVAFVFLLSSFAHLAISFFIVSKKFVRPKPQINVSLWKNALKTTYPFAFAGLFVMVYYRIDTLMLSWIKNEEAVGMYNAAYNILLGLAIVPSCFMPAIFPNLSRLYKQSQEKLKKIFKAAILLSGSLGVIITGVCWWLAGPIIKILYGNQYLQSIATFRILLAGIVFLFVSNVFGNLLNATEKQKWAMFSTLSMAVLNVLLNLYFIGKYSFNGAAIATSITFFFSSLLLGGLCWFVLSKKAVK